VSAVEPQHLRRKAYVYVRQSTLAQVERNSESLERQYELAGRAVALGWSPGQVQVVDADLGLSGAQAANREGFQELVAQVALGRVGLILGLEASRLARSNSDWYQLLGAPRGAVYSCGDGRAPPPGRRSGLVEAEGSLIREAPGRVGAALTTTGRAGTARRSGPG
jgi:hypothetical protein